MMIPTVTRTARRQVRLQLRCPLVKCCPPGWLGGDCSGSGLDELWVMGNGSTGISEQIAKEGTMAGDGQ